jgi:hypothetical protein
MASSCLNGRPCSLQTDDSPFNRTHEHLQRTLFALRRTWHDNFSLRSLRWRRRSVPFSFACIALSCSALITACGISHLLADFGVFGITWLGCTLHLKHNLATVRHQHAELQSAGLQTKTADCALQARNFSKIRCHRHSLKSEIQQYRRTTGSEDRRKSEIESRLKLRQNHIQMPSRHLRSVRLRKMRGEFGVDLARNSVVRAKKFFGKTDDYFD